MSTDWSIAFKPILDLHYEAMLTADSASARKCVMRKIHKAILAAQDEKEEVIALPTSLKKAIKEYYAKSIKDKKEADECKAKLFKQEIDKYDKAEQQSKGLEYSIKYCTGHAREWFNNMTPSQQWEVKFAMKKWNEGAPEEAQAIYHKNNLKKTLEDLTEQMRCTMGCHIVMLVSHKKKASQTLSISLHESMPQNAKKKFSSKTEFYPSEDSDHVASDCEDGPVLPEIIVDDDGYAKLPIHDGIGLKGQHKLIRSIFHISYSGSRPIPWGVITASTSNYLEPGSVLTGLVVKDPSHMKTEKVQDEGKTLSKNENYLELVDAIRDLAILAKQKPISERHQDLPIWADWSWSEVYLPEDVHSSYAALVASLNKLQTCPISGLPSAMPVVLGIGLLYRESKHIIEYDEDEAGPNTPFYLPHSVIDLQFLVSLDNAVWEVLLAVVEHIERLTKEGLSDEDEKEVVINQERVEVGEKDVESEENVVGGEKQHEQKVKGVVQKGRKRGIHQASSNSGNKLRLEYKLAFLFYVHIYWPAWVLHRTQAGRCKMAASLSLTQVHAEEPVCYFNTYKLASLMST
ncbi:hypothetical protein BDR04DRAFT_1120050 [Suillus decipiens]|nr:hypothetical protein BDR04DRAFT_1120050 [Suillus decipiens]